MLFFDPYQVNDNYHNQTVNEVVTSFIDIHPMKKDIRHNIKTGCPDQAGYPHYILPSGCIDHYPVIWPFRRYFRIKEHLPPVFDTGIVFYVYAMGDTPKRYMDQVVFNTNHILLKDPTAHIALITNKDIPTSLMPLLSVIVPIHYDDVREGIQFYTRMAYNTYLPFNYSFILDTHVFPCYNTSYSQLFEKFKEADVDVSVSNRMDIPAISGGAVLSRRGPGSTFFWKQAVKQFGRTEAIDDQGAIKFTLLSKPKIRKQFKFRQLSSNWFFASHGINERGFFKGPAKCYRSSVVVTGPVQWIHGTPGECIVMNGAHDEHADKYRAYYKCGKCKCQKGPAKAVFSQEEMQSLVTPNEPPKLLWNKDDIRDPESLFWDLHWK